MSNGGKSFGGETSKVRASSIDVDLCDPWSRKMGARLGIRYTLQTAYIVLLDTTIAHVLRMFSSAHIPRPVVEWVHVDMVYAVGDRVAIVHLPNNTVCFVMNVVNAN